MSQKKYKIIVIFESNGTLFENLSPPFKSFQENVKDITDTDFTSFKKKVLREYKKLAASQSGFSAVMDINAYRNERVVLVSLGKYPIKKLLITTTLLGNKYYRMWRRWNHELDKLEASGIIPGSKIWMDKLSSLRAHYSNLLKNSFEEILQVLRKGSVREKEAAAFMITYVDVSKSNFTLLQNMLIKEENSEIKNALARSIAELATRNTHRKISWKVILMMLNDPMFRCKDKGLAMIEIEMVRRHALPPYIEKRLTLMHAYPSKLLRGHLQKIDKLKVLFSI